MHMHVSTASNAQTEVLHTQRSEYKVLWLYKVQYISFSLSLSLPYFSLPHACMLHFVQNIKINIRYAQCSYTYIHKYVYNMLIAIPHMIVWRLYFLLSWFDDAFSIIVQALIVQETLNYVEQQTIRENEWLWQPSMGGNSFLPSDAGHQLLNHACSQPTNHHAQHFSLRLNHTIYTFQAFIHPIWALHALAGVFICLLYNTSNWCKLKQLFFFKHFSILFDKFWWPKSPSSVKMSTHW